MSGLPGRALRGMFSGSYRSSALVISLLRFRVGKIDGSDFALYVPRIRTGRHGGVERALCLDYLFLQRRNPHSGVRVDFCAIGGSRHGR